MEKTKRLSKSSIAVIVLSILLVLSMVMGLTGAWFTDQDAANKNQTLQFGLVDVDVKGEAGSEITYSNQSSETRAFAKLLPGDVIWATGAVENNSDVKTYVYITADAYLRGTGANSGKVYKVYDVDYSGAAAAIGSHELITVGAVTVAIPTAVEGKTAQWALASGYTDLYVVEAFTDAEGTTPKQEVPFKSIIELDDDNFHNFVWIQEYANNALVANTGAVVELNGNTLAAYELYVTITMRAVQFEHVTDAAAAYTILANPVEVHGAQPAVQQGQSGQE